MYSRFLLYSFSFIAPAQQIENERVKLAKAQEKMEKIMLSIEKMK